MLNQAIEKLQNEIDKNRNEYIKHIGSFLLKYLQSHPGDAEEILKEGKSITGSINHIKSGVKSRATDGCAMVEDKEVYKLALKYFGINEEIEEIELCMIREMKIAPKLEAVSQPKEKKKFELNLDDLL